MRVSVKRSVYNDYVNNVARDIKPLSNEINYVYQKESFAIKIFNC